MGRETKINIAASLRAKFLGAWRSIIVAGLLCYGFALPAAASYLPFNTNTNMNVGIGSATPGTSLDVKGTVRAIGFIAGAGGITLGGVNNTSWPAGGANYWNYSGVGNIGVSTTAAVGIGTTFIGGTGEGAFTVMNGSVGIGTWLPGTVSPNNFGPFPGVSLDVESSNLNGLFAAIVNNSAGDGIAAFDSLGDGAALANGNGTGLAVTGIDGAGDIGGLGASSEGIDAALYGSGITYGLYAEGPMNYLQGNVGIGTFTPFGGGLIVLPANTGNVGIGSLVPGQALDVKGTARMTGFTLTGNGAGNGNVLVGNSVGVGTWMPASTLGVSGGSGTNYWLLNGGGNVGINTTQAVGIGTSFVGGTGEAKLSVMNGNVGIGTWVPGYALDIENGDIHFNDAYFGVSGEIKDSTNTVRMQFVAGSDIQMLGGGEVANGGFLVDSGNVGIGSATPGQLLDVQGTVRMKGLTLTGNGAGNGNVLVGNSVGVGTWMPVSTLGAAGGTNYWLLNGGSNVGINTTQAVGIGTSFVGGTGEATLSVMNGNVGIGTWMPGAALQVGSGNGYLQFIPNSFGQATINSNIQIDIGINQSSNREFVLAEGSDNGLLASVGNSNPNANFEVSNSSSTYPVFMLSSTTSKHGDLLTVATGGNVGIGTTTPVGGLTVMNGNVGIGTWVPAYTLEVMGSEHIGKFQNLYLDSGSFVEWGNTGGPSIEGGLSPKYLDFDTTASGANNLNIDQNGNIGIGTDLVNGGLGVMNGNVGIGTWAPGLMLDVKGTARMTGFDLTGNGAGSGNVLVGNAVGVGTWMPVSTLGAAGGTNYWVNDTGNIGINTTYAVGIGTISQVNKLNILGNIGIGTFGYDPFMQTAAPSGAMIMSGNLGIGTWSPVGALQIGNMWDFDNGGYKTIYYNGYDAPGDLDIYSTTGVASRIAFTSNGKIIFQVAGSGTVGTSINWADGMKVANTGNVGIGGTGLSNSPDAGSLFSVRGGASIGLDYFSIAAPVNGLEVEGNVGIGTFNPFGGGLIVIPANTGNVGIGSLVPGQALDVNGTVRSTGFTLTGNGAGNGNVLVGNAVGVGTWMPASTLGVSGGAGTNYWLLNGGGNVGINTTQAVGIGTSFVGGTGEAKLSVMNGNVGIGTWVPATEVDIEAPGAALDILDIGDATGTYLTVSGSGNKGGIETNTITAFGSTLDIWNGAGSGSAGTEFYHIASLDSYTSGTGQLVQLWADSGDGQFDPSSGNGVYNMLEVDPNINQTGTATGITRAIFINPNNPAAHDFRALETSVGNVGIGTISGNLGIGSQWPGQRLDVQGTARMNGFTLTGNGAGNGNVLVANSIGVGTWMPSSTLGITGGSGTNYWLLNGGSNVGINTTQAVGIGTSFVGGTGEAKLSVMNGNIGIGTWTPGAALDFVYYPSGGSVKSGIGFGAAAGSSLVLYQNSANSVQFDVAAQMNFDDSFGRGITIFPGHAGGFQHYGDDASTATEFFQFNTDANITGLATANGGLIQTDAVFAPASGTFNYSSLMINDTINQTGTSAGITRGILVNPILTSTRDFRAIETSIGNVGIGTISGNLGIGSQWPGQRLDVNGTARMGGFTLTGNGAANGNVLVGNAVGVGTWMPASTLGVSGGAGTNYWLLNGGGNVGINTTQAVGIGTSFVGGAGEAAFSVMNGNVGIGTWVPADLLQVGKYNSNSSGFEIDSNGNVGIGTTITSFNSLTVMNGNIGIGTFTTLVPLQVSINQPISTDIGVSNDSGNAAALAEIDAVSNAGTVQMGVHSTAYAYDSGAAFVWNQGNTDLYFGTNNLERVRITAAGNVGIGTTTPVGGLTVMNGNVGIGTWVPSSPLTVEGAMTSIVPSATASFIGLNFNTNEPAALVSIGNSVSDTEVGFNIVPTFSSNAKQLNNYLLVGSDSTLGDTNEHDTTLSVVPSQQLVVLDSESENGNVVGSGFPIIITTGNDTTAGPGLYIGNSSSQNIGIGTSNPQGGLTVMNGNVGIGTWVPGLMLDVKGTIRMTGFNMPTGAGAGKVLTSDASGNGTWGPSTGSNYWLLNGGSNVGINTTQAVGIGTSFVGGTGEAALSVMNGSVGIGTWIPGAPLDVYFGTNNGEFYTSNLGFNSIKVGNAADGAMGFFTNNSVSMALGANGGLALGSTYFNTDPGSGNMIVQGNIGIGSLSPGQVLDVKGTARMTGFTLTGNGAGSGNVLVGNAVGVGTWMPVSTLGAASGTNYWLLNGGGNVGINTTQAVGIGTSFVGGTGEASFAVMNGNVGIGTWIPGGSLLVKSGNVGIGTDSSPDATLEVTQITGTPPFLVSSTATTNGDYFSVINGGNVGIGTWVPGNKFEVSGGNIGIGTGYSLNAIGTTSTILTLRNDTSSVYLGFQAGASESGGANNSAVGTQALSNGGLNNTAFGYQALNATSNAADTAVGEDALVAINGIHETALGRAAGSGVVGGGQNVNSHDSLYLGSDTVALADGDTDEIVIGAAAVGIGSYSVELGESNIARTQLQGNVGIGTFAPNGKLIVINGNVGIGSLSPGQALDVTGTVRMTGLTLTGNGAASGNVLVGNGVGVGTWMPASTLGVSGGASGTNYWLNDTGNIGINTAYAVGIGTISQANKLNILGNVGIGTLSFDPYMRIAASSGGMIMAGNLGIGTWGATAALQIGANSLSGSGPPLQLFLANFSSGAGYPQLIGNWNNLTNWGIGQATPSTTDNAILLGVTAAPNSAPFSWSSTGLNVLVSGNIGIGTITTTGMNTNLYVPTNVGIGTKTPADTLDVVGNPGSDDIAVFQNTSVSGETDIGFRDNTGVAKLWLGYGNASFGVPYTAISFMEFDSPAFEITNNNGAVLNEYFTSTGNIGIGTFNPLSKLNVNGGVGIGTTLTNNTYLGGNSAPSGGLIVQGNVGIGTWIPNSGLQLGTSFAVYRTGTAASVTSAGQVIIGVTDTTVARTITLATTDAAPGRIIIIKDESGGAATHNITVSGGGKNIDNTASVTISANYGVIRVYSDGNNWFTF